MKGKKERHIKYGYLTTLLFVLVIFACFAVNLYETASNIRSGEDKGVRAIAADAESIDRIVYPFVNLNGAFQNIMKRDYVYDADPANDTIKKSDGYIVSVPSGFSKEEVETAAGQLKDSSDWLSSRGIPLIYVQAPSKMSISDEPAMPGIPNKTYGKNAAFRDKALELGVEYIDASVWLEGDDSDFYITDHHWTTQSGFRVAAGICEYLNTHYDFGVDLKTVDESNYEFRTHRNAFLGAEGRRTGIWYAGLDDFTEIIPKFDTDFAITISDKDGNITERAGTFDESVMDMSKDVSHYSFEDSAYYEYWSGDYGRVHVVNNKNPDGRKVLIFKDSFGIPVTAFLTNAFSSMDIIDVRYYNDDKSIRSIIEEEQPDAVLYVYGTGYLSKKKMFKIK